MDSKTNTIRLDFRDNPDLKTLLGGYGPGDKVVLELEVSVKSNDEQTFEASVDSIDAESCDEEASEEEGTDSESESEDSGETESGDTAVKPKTKTPVMIVMMAKSGKKGKPPVSTEE